MSLRIVTMPIQSQGIITRDNVSVVFPAPLMTTIAELGTFLAGETHAAGLSAASTPPATGPVVLPGPGAPPPANGSSPAPASG